MTPTELDAAAAEFREMLRLAVLFGCPGTLTADVDGRTLRKVDYHLHLKGAPLQALIKGAR